MVQDLFKTNKIIIEMPNKEHENKEERRRFAGEIYQLMYKL